jgi:glycerol-3-phosphate acyltransferase PlsY
MRAKTLDDPQVVGLIFPQEGKVDLILILIIALVAYLIGSISFARVITRIVSPQVSLDKMEIPLQNSAETFRFQSIGANTVSSKLGPKVGMLVAILDILKAFVPVLVCRLAFPEQPAYMLIAGLASMAGHNWPVYYKFEGGSGFSPLLGSLLAIDPLAVIVVPVLGILLGMVVLRNIIFAFLGWLVLLIPWMWFRTEHLYFVLYAVGANLLFGLAMIPEYKLMQKYKREGKYLDYGMSSISATPMGRGMLKLAERFKVPIK